MDRGVWAEAVGSGPVTARLCHWLQESYQRLSLEYSVFLVILPRGHGSADELCCPQILMSSEGVLWQRPEGSEELQPGVFSPLHTPLTLAWPAGDPSGQLGEGGLAGPV